MAGSALKAWAVGLALLAAAPSVSTAAEPLPFAITLPAGFAVTKEQGPDFAVYRVAKAGREFVGVYVGNYPQFEYRTVGDPGDPTDDYAGRRPAGPFQQTVECENGVAKARSVLLVLPDSLLIHIWTADGTAEQRALAERILTSISVTGSNAGIRLDQLADCS